MEKYIILTASSGEQFYVAADPIYVTVDTSGAADMVQGDADAINAAVAECWTKPYTEPTISATLLQDVTGVSPV